MADIGAFGSNYIPESDPLLDDILKHGNRFGGQLYSGSNRDSLNSHSPSIRTNTGSDSRGDIRYGLLGDDPSSAWRGMVDRLVPPRGTAEPGVTGTLLPIGGRSAPYAISDNMREGNYGTAAVMAGAATLANAPLFAGATGGPMARGAFGLMSSMPTAGSTANSPSMQMLRQYLNGADSPWSGPQPALHGVR